MAASNLFLLTILALSTTMPLFIATTTSARSLNYNPIGLNANLEAKLNLDKESSNCWDSLFQLQACAGEVVMFFLNGETYLGQDCSEAIRTIKH
ncbi:egg cell-secreted protein 1.1-like [Prunus yedoensis var. nudiflora]|uniref:Egg cell-secreted protein 1.1-like n=1 Tax=Prunus yedoensis var. nudiflora TaxID=2094558 RepID=A0A314UKD1_PRUYE|nr:egg cell-secreted protein 1.1-like [Prunus yedoensis var. nudiflora]